MNCLECLERLYPYLDRELDAREVEEVREHLEECGGCASELVVERVFLDRIRDAGTSDLAPAAVRERLILRIRSEVARGSTRPDR